MIAFLEFLNVFNGWNLWPIVSSLILLAVVVFPIAVITAIWDKWFRRDD